MRGRSRQSAIRNPQSAIGFKMYLKELQLAGFKSFAQPVRLELGPGVTAVVGPNGSGKSNIVDAVRWVLGEQSARALRGARSEDVIFGGSAQRHPLGMAEVTLVLDNGDRRVSLDVAELAIARRLYSSGDSEYLLNRRRTRLRDVLDVAAQAGLGPDSYCVVGQGAIELLALQRPQDRRDLIADAADIRRYEARLAEIETDLTQTQQNALRMAAVVAEIRPQLNRLRVQAERAERHHQVREEVEHVARAWFGRALPAARQSLEAAERHRLELQASIGETRTRLLDLERRQNELHAAGQSLRSRAAEIERALGPARTEREGLRVESATLEERLRALSRRTEEAQRERPALEAEVETAKAALAGSSRELEQAAADGTGEGAADVGNLAKAEARVAQARRWQAEAERELESAKQHATGSRQEGHAPRHQATGSAEDGAHLLARLPAATPYRPALAAILGETAAYRVVAADGTAWNVAADGITEAGLTPEHREEKVDPAAFRDWVQGALRDIVNYRFALDVVEKGADAGLAARYLGRSIVVGSLAEAQAAALRLAQASDQGQHFQVATLDGQCLRSNGERVLRATAVGDPPPSRLAVPTRGDGISRLSPARGQVVGSIGEVQEAVQRAEALLGERRAEADAAEAARREVIQRSAAAQAHRAVHAERLARLRDLVERDSRQVERAVKRLAALESENADIGRQMGALAPSREGAAASLAATEVRIAGIEREAAEIASAIQAHETSTEELAEEQRAVHEEQADLRAAEASAGADAERARGLMQRLEAELAAVADSLATHTGDFLGPPQPGSGELARLDDEALQARLVRALRELRSVGSVDYGVLAEYATLRDRHTFLTEQLDDLARAEATIREGMQEVRERMRNQFDAAFGEVNERFKETFRDLFQGGDAELVLSGDADNSAAGVDIIAQPPGKRLHRLATLSGGERALVGAALLLALVATNPSPFCVLDEVDAALDDANVQRFASTIREMAARTQFILITHNRATMEMADALYGVTMTPGAVSQVLAIRLPD